MSLSSPQLYPQKYTLNPKEPGHFLKVWILQPFHPFYLSIDYQEAGSTELSLQVLTLKIKRYFICQCNPLGLVLITNLHSATFINLR
jgi:hypothetical protein